MTAVPPDEDADRPREPPPKKPANAAPDAVKDPNEKTEGMPGMGGDGSSKDGEADPGAG